MSPRDTLGSPTSAAYRAGVRGGVGLLLGFAVFQVTLHLLAVDDYGIFRDELYYLACSDHLDWGYVDHPPLSILLLWLVRGLLGESMLALRLLPMLAGAATVFVTGWICRELGGGRTGQAIAMLSVLVAPQYLYIHHVFSMNAFDVFLWTLAAALLVRIFQGSGDGTWLWLGLVLGLGLMNKISVLWLGAGLAVGLVVTEQRRRLRSLSPWAGATLALLIFSPYVVWQVLHDWPTIEFIRNAAGGKMATIAPLELLTAQAMNMNPVTLPVWAAGLFFFLFTSDGRRYRVLGVAWIVVLVILLLPGTSRPGYLGPSFPMLFAGGGLLLERLTELRGRSPWLRRSLRGAALTVLVGAGLLLGPLGLPILPVETYIRYADALGVQPSTNERKQVGALPQHYADMFGWQQIVSQVADVHASLPPQERDGAAIFTQNYGEAGAVDRFGPQHGLPHAISGHNSYWLWGTRGHSGEVVIIVGGDRQEHLRLFRQVDPGGRTDCTYCMPYEDGQTIWIARGLRMPLEAAWPQAKHFE